MHIYSNSVLHYLYNMAVGFVIYSKVGAFKAKAKAKARECEGQGQSQD